MTAQEHSIDTLALTHGALAVSPAGPDGEVYATAPTGATWRVAEAGHVAKTLPNHHAAAQLRAEGH